ncbi:hypothetical protein VNO77_23855 [Canavalia gladiata]|uniref:BHLH domain-containing protein n=1 Tax=Canavalia gladiata TaxID=3824 RepID=A0AAN9L556_CANGL
MDGVFALPQAARTSFLRHLAHSFGCAYVSLWRHDSNLSNRLFFLDGFYKVTNNQPSSSLGSNAERLFHQYQRLTFDVNDGIHLPFLELQQLDLLRLTSTEIQTQFFQEARIKIVVFMGCNKGEIELGFSNMSQVDIQTSLRNLFPEDFSTHWKSIDQKPSSSFISLSTGSLECSSRLFSMAGASQSHFPIMPTTQTSSHQALVQAIPSHFPNEESEHDVIVRALLHVITSTSHQHQPLQNLPNTSALVHTEATAFKRYGPDMSPNITPQMGSTLRRRQSLFKRSLAFSKILNSMRMRQSIQPSPPTITQLHHIISERKRREKLSMSFQALRALLPSGTKRNRASILTAAKEIMSFLMDEIQKLNIRNQQLMTFLPIKEAISIEENKANPSNERFNVGVWHVLDSNSSQEPTVDLQVTVRGESSQLHILIRLLEFIKTVQNVSLISMGSNDYITEGTVINQVTLRLRILEGSEWNALTFQEAVRRVVADLLQWQLDK